MYFVRLPENGVYPTPRFGFHGKKFIQQVFSEQKYLRSQSHQSLQNQNPKIHIPIGHIVPITSPKPLQELVMCRQNERTTMVFYVCIFVSLVGVFCGGPFESFGSHHNSISPFLLMTAIKRRKIQVVETKKIVSILTTTPSRTVEQKDESYRKCVILCSCPPTTCNITIQNRCSK